MTREMVCLWCGHEFLPHRGGSAKRFCSSQHRTGFHSAARRFAEQAVAAGILTITDIRNGVAPACTLLPCAISPAPISPAHKLASVVPAERPDEPAELLDDFVALIRKHLPHLTEAQAREISLTHRVVTSAGLLWLFDGYRLIELPEHA